MTHQPADRDVMQAPAGWKLVPVDPAGAQLDALEQARVHVEDAYNYSELASKEGAAACVALEVIDAALKGVRG